MCKKYFSKIFLPIIRAPFCKIWLVGLKIIENLTVENDNFRQLLNEKLGKEFDAKIKLEYELKVLRGLYQNINLDSKYITRDQLQNWWEINIFKLILIKKIIIF